MMAHDVVLVDRSFDPSVLGRLEAVGWIPIWPCDVSMSICFRIERYAQWEAGSLWAAPPRHPLPVGLLTLGVWSDTHWHALAQTLATLTSKRIRAVVVGNAPDALGWYRLETKGTVAPIDEYGAYEAAMATGSAAERFAAAQTDGDVAASACASAIIDSSAEELSLMLRGVGGATFETCRRELASYLGTAAASGTLVPLSQARSADATTETEQHLALAFAYEQAGDPGYARRLLVEYAPTYHQICRARVARLHARDGHLAEAEAILETVGPATTRRAAAERWWALAVWERARGDAAAARRAYVQASLATRGMGDEVQGSWIDIEHAELVALAGDVRAAATLVHDATSAGLGDETKNAQLLRRRDIEAYLQWLLGHSAATPTLGESLTSIEARWRAGAAPDAYQMWQAMCADMNLATQSTKVNWLSLGALLALTVGQHAEARQLATIGAKRAISGGHVRAHVISLLVLSAVTRASDERTAAIAYATDALMRAGDVGLDAEYVVASYLLESLSQATNAEPVNNGGVIQSWLMALGITSRQRVRCIDARGAVQAWPDASETRMQVASRSLVVDATRNLLWLGGRSIDLRRRALLKRLLYLLARSPAHGFTKEQLARDLWGHYEPLQHDPALFTNIMRLRKLLADPDMIQAQDGGYVFAPPADFLFVSAE